jgi:thiosulfate/3-mercaptopyruvate sulfurtransferase
MSNPAFVSVPWVQANFEAPGISIIDGSWHMPAAGRDAQAEFAEKALPGAIFFDIEQVADTAAELPHTCPTTEQFAQAMSTMGIKNTDFIVIYDTQGLFTAARVWWLFRLFGHERVAIMEGGLPAWEAANLPICPGEASVVQSEPYAAVFNDALFAAHHDVERAVEAQDVTIFDARSAGRYSGAEPEPRPNLPSGHMPGAVNVPFNLLIDSATGGLKSKDQLRDIFGDALSVEQGIITTCGSGVTACVLALALYHLGITARVYDGSWTEWASQPDASIRVLNP